MEKSRRVELFYEALVHSNRSLLRTMGRNRGFVVDQNKDYDAGPIDVVSQREVHPLLPPVKCGFVALSSDEEPGGSKD